MITGQDLPAEPGLGGALAQLFRTYVEESGIKDNEWSWFLQRFVETAKSRTKVGGVLRSFTPTNLNREFGAPRLTWLSFIRALKCSNAIKIGFTLHVTRVDRNGKHVETATRININTQTLYNPNVTENPSDVSIQSIPISADGNPLIRSVDNILGSFTSKASRLHDSYQALRRYSSSAGAESTSSAERGTTGGIHGD